MISDETKQRIKETARIEEVIGEVVQLKRNGSSFKGLCPFHNERTPSFHVTPSKGFFKCFGCGVSGDVITFVMKNKGLSFVDALVWLAQKYNIPVEERERTEEDIERQKRREAAVQIMQWATKWFETQLLETDDSLAKSFLLNNLGMTENQMADYHLGFWPMSENHDLFLTALKAEGYDLQLVQELGLITKEDDMLRDAYPGCVLFPLRNNAHNTITLLPMRLDENHTMEKMPASILYKPLSDFFGYYELDRQRLTRSHVMVRSVEELLRVRQVGLDEKEYHVVATAGQSINDHFLRRHAHEDDRFILFYPESDIDALLTDLTALLAAKLIVKVVFPPSGTVLEYLRNTTADEVKAYVEENQMSFIDAIIQHYDGQSAEEILEHIVPLLNVVTDKKSMYVHKLSMKLELSKDTINSRLKANG